ncbi:MAG TPA: hypothetical protein VFU43_01990 [Streptosporangiaceae bacterium]|nr:hypothetical protein [Streptosporangiaceae bacterium]
MPDSSIPAARTSATQRDAVDVLATLLARHPHLPALHWSVTTRGRKLIGTGLSDDPSLQRAETRAWAQALGIALTEARSGEATYLYGQAMVDGVRLFLHTMIIVPPDEDSERLLARILGDS